MYKESKRAKLEREKEERKQQLAIVEFSQQELAWATVPGEDFDPTEREFSVDELRPQPIIRKRKKVIIINIILICFGIIIAIEYRR